jgi:putative ABC transport system substrate-binding protein
MNPDNPVMKPVLQAIEERAQALNVKVQLLHVRRLDELDVAVSAARGQIEALTITDEGLFIANAKRIADVVMRNRLPGIGFREFCEEGGLLAYSVDFAHIWSQAAVLVDKILKGAKPGELPIQQATRFELIVNRKALNALGISIPTSFELRLNQIIE